MGISPDIWGPSTWTFLHLIVLAENDDISDRLNYYKKLYDILVHLLPCGKCRKHLEENIKALKDIEDLKTKRELFDWTTQIHNNVNKLTNKRQYTMDESFEMWTDISNGKKIDLPTTREYTNIILIIILLIALFIVGFVLGQLFHKK